MRKIFLLNLWAEVRHYAAWEIAGDEMAFTVAMLLASSYLPQIFPKHTFELEIEMDISM